MQKLEKKWDLFLEELTSSNNEFDIDLGKYLTALVFISKINIEDIDNENKRNEINDNLKEIVSFIDKYKNEYYEIGLIKGFKTNDSSVIRGRDYYYYIADQKMKASVYYVRYLNFIEHTMYNNKIEIIKDMNKIKSSLGEQEEKINLADEDLLNEIEKFIRKLDDLLIQNDEFWEIRQKCIECRIKIKACVDTDYMKYMMFNNMMREIRYVGASYQYLWHWESKCRNLFRNASYEGQNIKIERESSKKDFFAAMFRDVIEHMNYPSGKLCSYSEDPYIDIYKYLKVNNIKEKSWVRYVDDADVKIDIEDLHNTNKAKFEIVKSAKINSIIKDGKNLDFYDFIQDGEPIIQNKSLAYLVELYPDLRDVEKNSKGTTKNIKSLLDVYLRTWSESSTKLLSYVADDKEVICYGKIEQETYDVDQMGATTHFKNGCKYCMELSKEAVIYLLLTLRESNITDLVEKMKFTLKTLEEKKVFNSLKSETSIDNIEGEIKINITNKKSVSIRVRAEVTEEYIKKNRGENTQLISVKKAQELIEKEIEKKLQNWLEERYEKILNDGREGTYVSADFIKNFIEKEKHRYPDYINEYNEYEPDKNDEEISILKYLIFKRG